MVGITFEQYLYQLIKLLRNHNVRSTNCYNLRSAVSFSDNLCRPYITGRVSSRWGIKQGVKDVSVDDSDDLSRALDEEELTAIAMLTHADVIDIDRAIMSQLNNRWQKTALVVARAMFVYPDKYDDIPDTFYGQRIMTLCSKGLIEADGDLRQFRSSEIRAVPVDEPEG
jgi:hypothetical protein